MTREKRRLRLCPTRISPRNAVSIGRQLQSLPSGSWSALQMSHQHIIIFIQLAMHFRVQSLQKASRSSLSPLALYAFLFSFVHPLEQNSVIEPSQGSLQRFFRGGGLSPSAIKREGGESANSTNTVGVESSCNILLTTGTRFNSTHSTKLRDSQCSSVSKHVDLTVRAFYPT